MNMSTNAKAMNGLSPHLLYIVAQLVRGPVSTIQLGQSTIMRLNIEGQTDVRMLIPNAANVTVAESSANMAAVCIVASACDNMIDIPSAAFVTSQTRAVMPADTANKLSINCVRETWNSIS